MKIGFLKLGNLGISQVVDLLQDERADRADLDVRTFSTGTKLTEKEAMIAEELNKWAPDLSVVISPNASLPGPTKARELLPGPTLIISDGPTKKIKDELEKKGLGYIILSGDALIGARREFLDPTEMSIFNSDLLKVLSICGAIRLVQEEIDKLIEQAEKGKISELPRIVGDAFTVVERARFSNPYARAKAIAAYSLAEKVAEMDTKACFVLKEPSLYIQMASAAHEVLSYAAKLAEEAREIEKSLDMVVRTPHAKTGEILKKEKLLEKPV
jgi:methylenetetrahydromethanopterin dehydrogenase